MPWIRPDSPNYFFYTMATRSRIGLLIGDESVVSVYHHWDGYPEWLGVFLRQNYRTKDQVAELLDGGDISCIDSDSDWNLEKCEPHVQYYNDRGEKTEPRLDLNEDDFFENNEEYSYIFDDGKWTCYDLSHKYDDDYNVTGYIANEVKILTKELNVS